MLSLNIIRYCFISKNAHNKLTKELGQIRGQGNKEQKEGIITPLYIVTSLSVSIYFSHNVIKWFPAGTQKVSLRLVITQQDTEMRRFLSWFLTVLVVTHVTTAATPVFHYHHVPLDECSNLYSSRLSSLQTHENRKTETAGSKIFKEFCITKWYLVIQNNNGSRECYIPLQHFRLNLIESHLIITEKKWIK